MNIKIRKGEIFGFIGPNGAGKTTTIDILATVLKPSFGDAFIDGYSVVSQVYEVRKIIGYLPDFFGVYENLKVWEYLDFFAKAYKINDKKRIDEVLEIVRLKDKKNCFIYELSRGMKQKLGIAKALIHDPEVLILDEPASGLDPKSRIELKEILRRLGKEGKTIFISSHILSEVEDICTSIGVIDRGKLIAVGSKEDIYKRIYKENRFMIKFIRGKEEILKILDEFGATEIDVKKDAIEFSFEKNLDEIARLIREIAKAGDIVEFKEIKKPSLEDVFIKIIRGD